MPSEGLGLSLLSSKLPGTRKLDDRLGAELEEMTPAESKLIEALLSASHLTIRSEDLKDAEALSALSEIAAERVTPESRERFVSLHASYLSARKAMHEFSATLPRSLVEKWWAELPSE